MPVKRIVSEWTVLQVSDPGGTFDRRFYAFRNVALVTEFGGNRTFLEYLHTDFVARESAIHEDKWSGYFSSESDALAAIELYNKQVNTEPT